MKATAKKRHRKHTAPKTARRRSRKRKGLAEGLSSGIQSSFSPVLMGAFGGFLGLLVNSMLPKTSPLIKIAGGLVGGGLVATMLKAPNFAAGLVAGVTMPAVGQLLTGVRPGAETMNEGNYLSDDMPMIIDDDEYLTENLAAGYLSSGYLSDDDGEMMDY